jgi:hypothetical protein
MSEHREIVDAFLVAAPGFRPRWRAFLEEWDEWPGAYNAMSELAQYLVDAYEAGDTSFFPDVFACVERLLQTGDDEVHGLVVIGLLEDIQNIASHRSFGPSVFRPWLDERTASAWEDLNRFWSGVTLWKRKRWWQF